MSTIDATCPECGAQYKLTPEQLAVAQGQVRCGACMTIFQAVPNPVPEVTAESLDDEVIIDDILMDDVVDESEDLGIRGCKLIS